MPLRIQYTVVVRPMEDLWKEISIVVWFHTTEDTVYCFCSPMEGNQYSSLISYHWGYSILLLFALWKEISIVVWFHTVEDTVYCCCLPYGRPMEGNQYSSLISYHWGYSILLLFSYGRPMEGNQYSSLISYHWGYSILLLFAYRRPIEGNQYSSLISYHWGYSILLLFAL